MQSNWQQKQGKVRSGMEMVTSWSKIITLDIFRIRKNSIFRTVSIPFQCIFQAFQRASKFNMPMTELPGLEKLLG